MLSRVIMFFGAAVLIVAGCAGPESQQADPVAGSSTGGMATPATGPRLVQDGFAILDFQALRDEYDRIYVVGEVKNVSTAARGVELQATLRDANERIVSVGNFYPASNHSIIPGEVWPFTYSFGRFEGGVRAELRIVGAFRTVDTVGGASR